MNIEKKAFAPHIAEEPGFTIQMRVDYADFMEQLGYAPPVAFGSKILLEGWLRENINRLKIEEIGTSGQAISSYGSVEGVSAFEQIWVKASYGHYRKVMKHVALKNYTEDAIRGLDADHVLSKITLSKVPNAWVALFPVPPGSNQGFGSIERRLPKYDQKTRRADLTPLAAFKIYSGKLPRNSTELIHAMEDINGQIMETRFTKNFIQAMSNEMAEVLHERSKRIRPIKK